MDNSILLVPIHLDALVLKTAQSVVQSRADFSKLPFFDGMQDHHSDRAYISEEILSQPFADQSLILKPGIHLHWALPDGLTGTMSMPIVYQATFTGTFGQEQGKKLWKHLHDIHWLEPFAERPFWAKSRPREERKTSQLSAQYISNYATIEALLRHPSFQPVPNRWLITRTDQKGTQEWIVESDYLYPVGTGAETESITYPVSSLTPNQPPFRYMGRKTPRSLWEETKHTHPQNYLDSPLTALGYGEPSFAAFYPNCHSVFGFYDNYAGTKKNLKYRVLGWYSEPQLNYYQHFLAYFKELYKVEHNNSEPPYGNILEALQNEFKWTISSQEQGQGKQVVPDQFVCYAELEFAAEPSDAPQNEVANVSITVGNTGTEALSAYLAEQLGGAKHKAIIEDQIEAAQFSSQIGDRQLDIGPKFLEMRHEKGFTAVHAGTLWSVRTQSKSNLRADAINAHSREQATLPDDVAHLLNQANDQQRAYDRAQDELNSLRNHIFADWYKYQICAYPPEGNKTDYPDVDRVKNYIEQRDLAYYNSLLTRAGVLALQHKPNGTIAADLSKRTGSLASQLTHALNQLWQAVQKLNQQMAAAKKNSHYVLQQVAAPRYWQANEPSILLTGPDARFTERLGQDGRHHPDDLLTCQLLTDAALQPQIVDNIIHIQTGINTIKTSANETHFAFREWKQQPWHPFMLEWSAEFFPAMAAQEHQHGSQLSPTYLVNNYDLAPNQVDFTPKSVRYWKGANTYLGSGVVTPYSGKALKARLTESLVRQLRLDEYPSLPATIKQAKSWLRQHYTQVLTAYKTKLTQLIQSPANTSFQQILQNAQEQIGVRQKALMKALKTPAESPAKADVSKQTIELNQLRRYLQIMTLTSAYKELHEINAISQSLSGFNAALLMQKETLQLGVNDPLGFDEYQQFAQQVRQAVQIGKRMAPQPLNDFNPVRAGALDILELRLIDTFGQIRTLDHTKILTTEQFKAADHNVPIYLPPRFSQPVRLNFRWLAANYDDLEANDSPASSPICGWIVPNHLDNSLMIYSQKGEALGSIGANDRDTSWRPAAGHATRLTMDQIQNPHLRQMVHFLANQQHDSWQNRPSADTPTFLDNFISVLDNACQNIEPENFANHQSQALLMGQPIALVRAQLNLELQGLPAHHQSWSAFIQDMQRASRDTLNVESLQIPVRIGEHLQLNDGLVGYWIESGAGYQGKLFYAPQSNDPSQGDGITDDLLVTSEEGDTNGRRMFNQLCTIGGKPINLTMLIDPRGSIHATSGLLPTKSIHIPPDQYAKALERIEITFMTAPLLTASGEINLSLPTEPGYVWSWLEQDHYNWHETGMVGKLRLRDVLAAFPDNQVISSISAMTIWERLENKGWIDVQADTQTALVRPEDKRKDTDLGDDFKNLVPKIEQLLDSTHLGHFKPEAHFSRQQEIREGWLKLRKAPSGE